MFQKTSRTVFRDISSGLSHDDVIISLRPESFDILRSCANQGFWNLNLAGITKFKNERKVEKDFGPRSKMTPDFVNAKSHAREKPLLAGYWIPKIIGYTFAIEDRIETWKKKKRFNAIPAKIAKKK